MPWCGTIKWKRMNRRLLTAMLRWVAGKDFGRLDATQTHPIRSNASSTCRATRSPGRAPIPGLNNPKNWTLHLIRKLRFGWG
jgi:hypothetical protein